MMRKKVAAFTILVCIATLGLVIFTKQPTEAITGADWSAGNIIDDAVFTNTGSMSVAQIQAFLNSKVPVCDTWGTGGSTTTARADYVRYLGYNVPLTCLRDFYEVPKTEPGDWTPANNYGGKAIPAGAKSAAEIIYNAAQQYHISPQVLLVKLGTESAGPLTSDDWPTPNQFTYAMGSHCPDVWNEAQQRWVAKCDPDYAGFSIQIYSAAKLLRYYIDSMGESWWPYRIPYQYNNISYDVHGDCESPSIYIANRATAALYTYTPYQPNQAALSNLYGEGDYCSSYGNRNFWTTFSNWFGSTHAINGTIYISKPLITTAAASTVLTGETITASYEVSNSADYDIAVGGLGICAKLDGKNYDFGFSQQNTITSKGKKSISYTKTLDQSGKLDIFVCSYNDQLGGWASSVYPYNTDGLARDLSLTIKDNPLVTSSVILSPTKLVAGQSVTVSFNIQNSSSNAVNIGTIVVATRNPSGGNADFPSATNITIPANSTYVYSKTQILSMVGNYTYFISDYKNNNWDTNYPKSSSSSIIRGGSFTVGDNPMITTGVVLNPASPAVGQSVTATFSIFNASDNAINIGTVVVAGRDPNGKNSDFDPDTNITIPANSTYIYSKTKIFDTAGKHSYVIANYRNNAWNTNYPKSSSSSTIRDGSFTVKENPLIVSSVLISPSNPVVGQTVTASFDVKNASDNPISIGTIVVAARNPSGKNADFEPDTNVVIPASSTYTYSKTAIVDSVGKYSFFISDYINGIWNNNYPKSSSSSIARDGSFTVTDNPLIIAGVAFTPNNPAVGQLVTATFSIYNASESAINIGTIVIAARDPSDKNADFYPDTNVVIPANSTYVYSKTKILTTVGTYNYFISDYKNGIWNNNYPKSSSNSIIRYGSLSVSDNPLITSNLNLSPTNPVAGQSVTATFNITNASASEVNIGTIVVAGRSPSDKNADFSSDVNVIIPANTTYSYSKTQTLTGTGTYNFFISNYKDSTWNISYPKSISNSIIRYSALTVK